MISRRTVALAAAVAAVGGGSAAAIAASVTDDAKKAEAEVLSDAAKKLGVESSALRKALADALDAQLDKAVKEGRLTQEQADAIKKRRAESGTVLPLGPGPGMRGPGGPHGGRHGGPGGRHEMMSAAAKALGLTEAQLHEQLEAGKTIADLAKSRSKDLADVKAAMKKAALADLDAAVKAGRLTDAQRDDLAEDLDARIDDKVNGRFEHGGPGRPGGFGHGHGMPPGPPPGAPGNAPGSAPAPEPGADYAPA